jgi:hypothetical protein
MNLTEATIRGQALLKGKGLYTHGAEVCPEGGHPTTTPRGRPAIRCLPGAGRHYFEEGPRHAPTIVGSVHSQAPPIP